MMRRAALRRIPIAGVARCRFNYLFLMDKI